MHVYRRINDGSKLIFDADQHPEVHLARNDYSFAPICKESTIFHGCLWIYLTVTQSKIDELVRNVDRNVIWNNLHTFLFKTQIWYFLSQQLSDFPNLCMISHITSHIIFQIIYVIRIL